MKARRRTRPPLVRTAAALSFALLLTTAGAASAGKGGSAPGGSSHSVKLRLLDPTDTVASIGDRATFDVSSSYSVRWVAALCYQNGALVYNENHGFFPDYPWGQTYTLGPTSVWTSGSATCTAELYTMSRNKRISLAKTSFTVAG